jgi:hypothetical protein
MLSAREVSAASRKTRGLFAFLKRNNNFKPTYNHQPDGAACRVYGSLVVKKVTGAYESIYA